MRALGAVLVLMLLAACSGEQREGRTELQFWAMGREGEVVRQLLPEFERRHPGVTVKVQNLAWTAAHAKLLTAFASDALPDVFQLGNTWIPEFAQLGALQPHPTGDQRPEPAQMVFDGRARQRETMVRAQQPSRLR